MNPASTDPPVPDTVVVVDTDVFSHLFVRSSGPDSRELRDLLVGRLPVIATQTEAELRVWPILSKWGPGKRAQLTGLLAATAIIPVTAVVVGAFAELTANCKLRGHALHQKQHTGDRWVAATAISIDRPLLTLDKIYDQAPGLTLLRGSKRY